MTECKADPPRLTLSLRNVLELDWVVATIFFSDKDAGCMQRVIGSRTRLGRIGWHFGSIRFAHLPASSRDLRVTGYSCFCLG